MLGDADESRRLADRAEQIAHAFVERYYDPATGQIEGQGQSAAAMALSMVPMQSEVSRHVIATLLDDIFVRRHGHLSTGLISTAHLIDALDAAGCNDELWRIIHQGGYPGWADMLSGGLTSIPEDWQVHKEPRRSRCHVPLGAVVTWFFRRLAGLQQSDDSIAYASLEMRPYFPDGLHWVEASLETIQGRIASAWHRDGDHVTWHITLPLGTTAHLVFPTGSHRPPETIGGGTHVMEFTI